MASSAYYTWVTAGRPITGLIRPLAQLRDKLRRYGYVVYDVGADDTSHLQAPTPEDHCPFSATGWPVPSPRWWIAAIDIMPPPAGSGLPSLQQLGARIFADRQAGLFAGLKYMNWESQRDWSGDCWHDSWQPDHVRRTSSDRGHIHLSGRSDRTTFTGDDGYDPVARIRGGITAATIGGDMNEALVEEAANIIKYNIVGWLADLSKAEATRAAADEARDTATLAAIKALAGGGTSLDTAAVIAEIRKVADQQTTVAAQLHAENQALRAALQAGHQAAATALALPAA